MNNYQHKSVNICQTATDLCSLLTDNPSFELTPASHPWHCAPHLNLAPSTFLQIQPHIHTVIFLHTTLKMMDSNRVFNIALNSPAHKSYPTLTKKKEDFVPLETAWETHLARGRRGKLPTHLHSFQIFLNTSKLFLLQFTIFYVSFSHTFKQRTLNYRAEGEKTGMKH